MAYQSIMKEYSPTNTVQFAHAILETTKAPINVHVKFQQLFITQSWRVRSQFIPDEYNALLKTNTHCGNDNMPSRDNIKQMLLQTLAPGAREAVEVLLLYPEIVRGSPLQNARRRR